MMTKQSGNKGRCDNLVTELFYFTFTSPLLLPQIRQLKAVTLTVRSFFRVEEGNGRGK